MEQSKERLISRFDITAEHYEKRESVSARMQKNIIGYGLEDG